MRNRWGGGLKLAEEIHDFRLAPLHRPDEFAADDPIAVDDVGFGPLEGAIERAGLLVRVTHGRKVNLVVFQELW